MKLRKANGWTQAYLYLQLQRLVQMKMENILSMLQ